MPRPGKVLCRNCGAKMATGTSFCPSCTHPTVRATTEERAQWEVAQWRALKAASEHVAAEEPDAATRGSTIRRVLGLRKTRAERLLQEWNHSMQGYEERTPGQATTPQLDKALPSDVSTYLQELERRVADLERKMVLLQHPNLKDVGKKTWRVPLLKRD